MKLEVVVVPVTDVDRAKQFYKSLGWREDADFVADEDFRIVQLTPPGSVASIQFGIGLTPAPPGSLRGAYLVVDDIGSPVPSSWSAAPGSARSSTRPSWERGSGPSAHPNGNRARPPTGRPTDRSCRSTTPTATAGSCRKSPLACPAGTEPRGDRGVVLPVLLGRSGRPGGLRARPRTALHAARAFSCRRPRPGPRPDRVRGTGRELRVRPLRGTARSCDRCSVVPRPLHPAADRRHHAVSRATAASPRGESQRTRR